MGRDYLQRIPWTRQDFRSSAPLDVFVSRFQGTAEARALSRVGQRQRDGHLARPLNSPPTSNYFFPDLKASYRALTSSQFTTFHHAAKYSGRRLLYFK
jgi:hypothetical protein